MNHTHQLFILAGLLTLSGFGVTLENENLSIQFDDQTLALTRIVNRIGGETGFINPNETKPCKYWMKAATGHWIVKISYLDNGGKSHTGYLSDANEIDSRRFERIDDGLRFYFEGVKLPVGKMDVITEVTLPKLSVDSEWRIKVVNHSPKCGVEAIAFPVLRGIAKNGEAEFLEPGGYLGWLRHEHYTGISGKMAEKYFSQCSPMVMAYIQAGAGLLIAAHNDKVAMSKLVIEGEQNATFCTPVENAGIPGKTVTPGFPISISAFRGDWLTAAKQYRTWATNQSWCAKGPKIYRDQASRDFAETALWLRCLSWGKLMPSNVSADIKRVTAAWPNLPIGIHWYGWHYNLYNTGYPDSFPAKLGATNTIALAKANGCRIMTYMNAIRWDTKTLSYQLFAKDGACQHANGVVQTKCFNPSYHPLALMCPTMKLWQDATWLAYDKAVNELGLNMVYLDELGLQHPSPCYAKHHPHLPGGGTWYFDGYHEIWRHFREQHPNVPITTEGSNEHWLDIIDGYLVAVPTAGNALPFYLAVYSDYASYFGSPLNLKANLASFRAYEARQFTWGYQPGWMKAELVLVPGRAEWMRKLGEARVKWKDFLCYGELIGELKTTSEVATIHAQWPKYESAAREGTFEYDYPAVIGTWWRTVDGRIALVAVNHTEKPETLSFTHPNGSIITHIFAPLSIDVID